MKNADGFKYVDIYQIAHLSHNEQEEPPPPPPHQRRARQLESEL